MAHDWFTTIGMSCTLLAGLIARGCGDGNPPEWAVRYGAPTRIAEVSAPKDLAENPTDLTLVGTLRGTQYFVKNEGELKLLLQDKTEGFPGYTFATAHAAKSYIGTLTELKELTDFVSTHPRRLVSSPTMPQDILARNAQELTEKLAKRTTNSSYLDSAAQFFDRCGTIDYNVTSSEIAEGRSLLQRMKEAYSHAQPKPTPKHSRSH